MKRILLMVLVAATLGLTASSCRKERTVFLESSGTRVAEVSVKFNDWVNYNTNDGLNYVYCPVEWDILTQHVVYDGNVNVYLYEGDRQTPLPYVYPIEVLYDDGTTGFVGENLYYTVETGQIILKMQDLDGYKPIVDPNTPTMTFRIVATAPIDYAINQ